MIPVFTVGYTSPNRFSRTVKLNVSVTIERQLATRKADGRGIHAEGENERKEDCHGERLHVRG